MGKGRWRCVIGLTGGLGCGKSTVLQMFKRKGAYTQDADLIVHTALRDKKELKKIRAQFGSAVFTRNGDLDRKAMASIVFASPAKRRTLEKILHPIVRKKMALMLMKRKGKVAVCDVPLLYERGWYKDFDKVVVVNASLPVRLKRLQKRGYAVSESKRRMKAQWPMSRKIKKADFVVQNNKSLKQTKIQVDSIWEKILNPT